MNSNKFNLTLHWTAVIAWISHLITDLFSWEKSFQWFLSHFLCYGTVSSRQCSSEVVGALTYGGPERSNAPQTEKRSKSTQNTMELNKTHCKEREKMMQKLQKNNYKTQQRFCVQHFWGDSNLTEQLWKWQANSEQLIANVSTVLYESCV